MDNSSSPVLTERFHMIEAASPLELGEMQRLFREYETMLGQDLSFQQFEAELAGLPGQYARPEGRLMLALASDGTSAGCVAMKPLKAGICEMKRLYVRPAYRGTGLGLGLCHLLITEAREAGYQEMWLDTLPQLEDAVALYQKLGFYPINPYYDNPLSGALFMGLTL